MSVLVNAEGGLTSLGYVCFVMAAIVFMAASFLLLKKKSSSKKMTTKQMVYCSVAIALAWKTV